MRCPFLLSAESSWNEPKRTSQDSGFFSNGQVENGIAHMDLSVQVGKPPIDAELSLKKPKEQRTMSARIERMHRILNGSRVSLNLEIEEDVTLATIVRIKHSKSPI
jgi:hypothetical protein